MSEMGGSILGVKVIGANGMSVRDSQYGSQSQVGPSRFGSSQKQRPLGSSRTGAKPGKKHVHVIDDFSSYDGNIQQ